MFVVTVIDNGFKHITTNGHQLDKDNNLKGLLGKFV